MQPTPSQAPGEPELPWTRVFFALLGVRAVVFACGVLSFLTAQKSALSRFTADAPLIYWDAVHYLSILREGYPPPPLKWIIAFFPLYPMLARPLAPLVGDVAALLIISNGAAVAGLLLTFSWARRLVGDRTAFAGALLVACYPPSVFLSSAYTEGPFMLCVAAALWFLGQNRYFAAAAVAGLSTALRPTGGALSVVVCLMALRQTADLVPAKRLATLAAVGLLSIAGLCAYEGFLVARYDRVDAYFVAQRDWEPAAAQEAPAVSAPDAVLPTAQVSPSEPRAEGPASGIVRRLTSPGAWNRVFVVVILGLSIFGLIRPGPIPREAFLLPILIFLVGWVPGWGARTTSIARFETAAIPCFVLVSYLLRKRTEWRWALIGAGFLLECGVYAVQVARGVWGG